MSEHKTGNSNWSAAQKARYWEQKEYKRSGKMGPLLSAELKAAKAAHAKQMKLAKQLEKEKARYAKQPAGHKA